MQQPATQVAILEKLAYEDSLTGISNRSWLDVLYLREIERARRFEHKLSVAMIDIDNFKQVNGRLSHLVADEVLRTTAKIIRDNSRSVDVTGRYSGEEFMLVLVETSPDQVREICEKIRQKVESHPWDQTHPVLQNLTISLALPAIKPSRMLRSWSGWPIQTFTRQKTGKEPSVCRLKFRTAIKAATPTRPQQQKSVPLGYRFWHNR